MKNVTFAFIFLSFYEPFCVQGNKIIKLSPNYLKICDVQQTT